MISDPTYVVPQVLKIEQCQMFGDQKHNHTEARQILFFMLLLNGASQKEIAATYHLPKQTISSAIKRLRQLLYYYDNLRLKVATIATKCGLISEYSKELNSILKS